MPGVDEKIQLYRELAEIYDGQGQAQMRDRFLVLAADTAFSAGQTDEAERLRTRLLRLNPHHLLKPYESFAEATKSPDVQNYLIALRRSHPYERTEYLRESLRREEEESKPGVKAAPPVARNDAPTPTKDGPDLQVYRVADGGETPRADPSRSRPVAPDFSTTKDKLSKSSPAPASSSQAKHAPAKARPTDLPSVYRLPSDNAGFEPVEDTPVGGAWVSVGLAGIAFLAGIILAVYTFARPFLPRKWLP
jgi:hypothetical protein